MVSIYPDTVIIIKQLISFTFYFACHREGEHALHFLKNLTLSFLKINMLHTVSQKMSALMKTL